MRTIWRRLTSPGILTTAAVLYTTLLVLWLSLVSYGVRLEHPADTRFVNISLWPTKPILVGLAWTLLLLPGGQGTLVLRSICFAFASLTVFRALLR